MTMPCVAVPLLRYLRVLMVVPGADDTLRQLVWGLGARVWEDEGSLEAGVQHVVGDGVQR